MIHLDLFSGIGGFAYAADQVFGDVEHIFCDNDKFCQQVLKKHWPEAPIYDDIRLITDTAWRLHRGESTRQRQWRVREEPKGEIQQVDLLTGGFPCQPFSAAGLRRGTADERHLWPEMLRVIKLTQPQWVIAENVRGILTWNEGLVFESVCTDLESAGYAVWPLIIPAVAVNAPHRRDRVWFIAHSLNDRQGREERGSNGQQGEVSQKHRSQDSTAGESERTVSDRDTNKYAQNSVGQRSRGRSQNGRQVLERQSPQTQTKGSDSQGNDDSYTQRTRRQRSGSQDEGRPGQHSRDGNDKRWDWSKDWPEVAAELCRVDDGLPAELDGFELSKSQHRKERLKSLGNAIVPQVAIEIMKGISDAG